MRPLALALAVLLAVPTASAAQDPSSPATPPAAGGDASAEWPRAIETPNGTLETYQPQLEKFEGVTLSGRSAVSWTGRDKAPVFGVIWFTATVSVDRDARMVTVERLTVDRVRFPNITKDEEARVASIIEREVPRWDLAMP